MPSEKAAMFVDNSNIFKGMHSFTLALLKSGEIKAGQYLRVRWEKLIQLLETQGSGIDVFARHFFASLPPAADVSKLRRRPSEQEWEDMVKKSAQAGFYKVIQDPPFSFKLYGIPLRFAEVRCGTRMRQAYFKCKEAYGSGSLECKCQLDPQECYQCKKKFLHKYEKGVDVALACHLVIFATSNPAGIDRIILVAGDGDFREALNFVRREKGKDVQIVSWRRALSRDLEKLANKPTIILDDHWKDLCEIRKRPPLDEIPAADEEVQDLEED